MNTVFELFITFRQYLPKVFLSQGLAMVILILTSTIVDLLGIATIFPLFSLFLSDGMEDNKYWQWVGELLHINDQNTLFLILLAVISCVLIAKTIFLSYSNYTQSKFIYRIYAHYVNQQYIKIFKTFNGGDAVNSDEIKSDIYILPRVFANQLLISFLIVVAEFFVLFLVLIFLVTYNWKIVLILVLSIVPIILVFYWIIRNKNEFIDKELKKYISRIAQAVSTAFFGNTDIRLSGSYPFFSKRFSGIVNEESKLLSWKATLGKMPPLVVEVSVLFAFIILVFINIYFGGNRDELLMQIGIFGVAALKLMPSINRLVFAVMNIKANMYCLDIVKDPIDDDFLYPAQKLEFNDSIRIKDVSFAYANKIPVFDLLSITINKGERIGIVGESGSGKSSLLKLLLGRISPDKGEICVDKELVNSQNLVSWQQLIGLVNQDVFILDDTLEANIAFGDVYPDLKKIETSIKHAALEKYIDSLPHGLETQLGEMGQSISGGQKQRVGIARALYKGAEILLLDEATSSLDSKTEGVILQSIENLPTNLTVITISHKISFLDFCDKVYRMENGKLIQVSVDKN